MKIVILGAKGMLGQDLVAACKKAGIETLGFDLPELDITRDDGGLDRIPTCDRVVNSAAFTDVDGAETKREVCFAVNGEGPGRVAEMCARRGIPLLHISTDYVFDGRGRRPLKEEDPVNPLSVYGESKLAGEVAVQKAGGRNLIVRTQALFGAHGKSFIRAITAKLSQSADPLRVVNDQTTCPTYTRHLADGILRLMKTPEHGIVHLSASGSCTWYEFACAIAAQVKPRAIVEPVTSEEYPRPARRPACSVLDKSRYEAWTGHKMPSWQEGMKEYLREGSSLKE
jgi:dTDP-4-dehydrorhamnose reductase